MLDLSKIERLSIPGLLFFLRLQTLYLIPVLYPISNASTINATHSDCGPDINYCTKRF